MSRVVLILLDGRQTLIVIRYHYFGQFRVSRGEILPLTGFTDKVCPIANEMILHLVREISIGYGNIVPVTRSEVSDLACNECIPLSSVQILSIVPTITSSTTSQIF